jgi:hypothetical protein
MTSVTAIAQIDHVLLQQQQDLHHQQIAQYDIAKNIAQADIAGQKLIEEQQQQILAQEAIVQQQDVQQSEDNRALAAAQFASAQAAVYAALASPPVIDPSGSSLVSGSVSAAFTQLTADAAAARAIGAPGPTGSAQFNPPQTGHEADLAVRAYSAL